MTPFERVGFERKFLSGQLAWFGAWSFVTLVGLILKPNPHGHGTHTQLGLPPCPSVLLFDRPCPGCGLTTSFTALLHGQVGFAFHAHAFGPLLYALFTGTAILSLVGWIRGWRVKYDSRSFAWGMGVFAACFFVFGVVRYLVTPNFASLDDGRAFLHASLR